MALGSEGKAFIEVDADLRPYRRTLDREIPKVLKEAEAAVRQQSRETFQKAGEDGGKSFDRAFSATNQARNKFVGVTSALASALDDGISALPVEAKAAIVTGIIAATPIISALLTGAISAGLVGGFGALGFFLAAQFEEVRDEAATLLSSLRARLLSASRSFVQPVLTAFAVLDERFDFIEISLRELFGRAAEFVLPLTDAVLQFVERLLPGLTQALTNLEPVLPVLVAGAGDFGEAIGEALAIITDSPFAEEGLRDLLALLSSMVVTSAALVRILTDIYGLTRLLSPLATFLDESTQATEDQTAANLQLVDAQGAVIALTTKQEQEAREQERALEAATRAIDKMIDAQFSAVSSSIAFERSLDEVSEAAKRNGTSLDIEGEKGRRNAENFLRALKNLRQQREDAVAAGKLDDAQAEAQYQRNLARLRTEAVQVGFLGTEFDKLAASVATVNDNPIDEILGPRTKENIAILTRLIEKYLKLLGFVPKITPMTGGERVAGQYADGGVFSKPTLGVIGEAGPEAVVPLSRPQRAAAVMAQAGIGGGDVYVFIGNEQLDSRMVRVASKTNQREARRMYAGTRTTF